MKKIKICMSVILFAMAVCILSACSNKESDKNQTTSPAGTTPSTTAAGGSTGGSGNNGTNGTSGTGGTGSETSGSQDEEESGTGVLDDMAEDLEEGADDVMNGPGVTSASDESR